MTGGASRFAPTFALCYIASRNKRDTLAASVSTMKTGLCLALLSVLPLLKGSVRIYQTNSAGDDLDVIDPADDMDGFLRRRCSSVGTKLRGILAFLRDSVQHP